MKENAPKKVIIFLPETGIYPYLRTLLTAADSISSGKQIYVTHCTGQMECCSMMAMGGNFSNFSPKDKSVLCKKCIDLFNNAQKKYCFSPIDMASIITSEVRSKLEKLIPENINACYTFTYKGLQIGKIALYDLVLATKILQIAPLNKENQVLYRKYILNTMIAMEIVNTACETIYPDLILTFNPYAQCQAAKYIAEKNNIFYKFLTNISYCGSDYSQYYVTKGFITIDLFKICQLWHKYSNIPILPQYVDKSWKDTIFKSYGTGSHIFSKSKKSTPAQLIKNLNLSENKKTIVAFTSSNDEYIGLNAAMQAWNISIPATDLFPSTSDWLKFLELYAIEHTEIQIIVRIHPREGIRQLGKPSEHFLLLQKEFKTKKTNNFIIIWPDDDISSYDLIELANLVLITISTMGLECARLGIPILSCSTEKYYSNASFMQVASNLKEYEDKLNKMINIEYTFSMLRDAIRYNYWRNFILAIDFSETVPHDFDNIHKWPFAPKKIKQMMYDICFDKISVDDMNIKKLTASVTEHSEKYETETLLKGIELYINAVMFPQKISVYSQIIHTVLRACRKGIFILTLKKIQIDIDIFYKKKRGIKLPKLIYVDNIRNIKAICFKKHAYISIPEDNYISYRYQKKIITRYSPLLYNLTRLYSTYNHNRDL